MDVYVKIHRFGKKVMLAICDENLLGKRFKEKELIFEIKKTFYCGIKLSADEALNLIEKSSIINLVGNNIVKMAIERGYVHPEAVLKIIGILHAQIIKM